MREAEELALAALARREHSRRELERKLAARGLDDSAVAAALDDLVSRGLQDDGRFAVSYVRVRAGKGFGPRRIVMELRERGIDAATASAACAAAETDFATLAHSVRERKFHRLPQSLPERAKQTRFLEYRGFEAAHIRHALGQTRDDEDY
ncbi:MAG: regulatory protein RecX [Gammaproteobacteria bacterium]